MIPPIGAGIFTTTRQSTPVMTDRDAAPDEIKKIVRCKCKADRDNFAIHVPARVVNTV